MVWRWLDRLRTFGSDHRPENGSAARQWPLAGIVEEVPDEQQDELPDDDEQYPSLSDGRPTA
jgi:hypothetical protein